MLKKANIFLFLLKKGGLEVYFHIFLNVELDGPEWSDSHYGHFNPQRKSPLYLLNSRMEGLQSRLGRVREKYTTITWNRTRCLCHPTRSLDTVSYVCVCVCVCVCIYIYI